MLFYFYLFITGETWKENGIFIEEDPRTTGDSKCREESNLSVVGGYESDV